MQNQHDPAPSQVSTPASRRAVLNTVLLAGATFLIPVLMGVLFVMASHRLFPRPATPADEADALLTNRLYDGSVTQTVQLAKLRREFREAGLATDEVDISSGGACAGARGALLRTAPRTSQTMELAPFTRRTFRPGGLHGN